MENRKIIDYRVVEAESVDDLTFDVSCLVKFEGWIPFGSVVIAADEGHNYYVQTLVKYSTE